MSGSLFIETQCISWLCDDDDDDDGKKENGTGMGETEGWRERREGRGNGCTPRFLPGLTPVPATTS